MSHATASIHERENFGSTFDNALMMTNPTMNNRRNRSIDWPSLERQKKGSSQQNCRKSSSSSANETNQPSIKLNLNIRVNCLRTQRRGEFRVGTGPHINGEPFHND